MQKLEFLICIFGCSLTTQESAGEAETVKSGQTYVGLRDSEVGRVFALHANMTRVQSPTSHNSQSPEHWQERTLSAGQ